MGRFHNQSADRFHHRHPAFLDIYHASVVGLIMLIIILMLGQYFWCCRHGIHFRPISGKHQHWPLSKNILRHSYSANTMALSWNSDNTVMFFVVLLLFLILICFTTYTVLFYHLVLFYCMFVRDWSALL